MNRILQRAVALLLIPLTAFSIIINSYGTAYAAAVLPVTYGMGEVWWTLCASMGISFELTGTDAVQEFGKEMKDTFDLWVTDNGFDEIDANAIKEEIAGLPSKVKDGSTSLSQKAWEALKSFRNVLLREYTDYNDYILCDASMISNKLLSDSDINISSSVFASSYGLISYLSQKQGYYIAQHGSSDLYYLNAFDSPIVSYSSEPFGKYTLLSGNSDYCVGGLFEIVLGNSQWSRVSGFHRCDEDHIISVSNFYPSDCIISGLGSFAHDLCPVTQPYLDGYDVVTKGRTWSDTNGLTGDLILNIPSDLVGQDVITGGLTWEDIMDRIGVIPVDTVGDVVIPWDNTLDVPETIPDAIDRVNDTTIDKPGTEDKDDEKTDDDEDLDIKIPSAVVDLKKQFPFCIPFDLIDCVKMFSADAKAPKWEFDIYIKPIKYHWILTIDMSDYDALIKLFKTGQVILFIVGLAILTPTVTKWNGGGE